MLMGPLHELVTWYRYAGWQMAQWEIERQRILGR